MTFSYVNYDECRRHNAPVRGNAAGGGVVYADPGIEPFMTPIWSQSRNPDIPRQPELIFLSFLGSLQTL